MIRYSMRTTLYVPQLFRQYESIEARGAKYTKVKEARMIYSVCDIMLQAFSLCQDITFNGGLTRIEETNTQRRTIVHYGRLKSAILSLLKGMDRKEI